MRYPTIEQEATAILWALIKWQHFLLGGGCVLETDHRPLQFITTKINSNGKLARMALRLQEFQPFKVVHIPGKDNCEADFLSRLVATIELDFSEQDDLSFRINEKPDDFITDELGRFRFVGDGNNRLAIPRKHRQEILKALHDDHGHFHQDRVLELARSRFYWKDMNKDIKAYIKACHQCAVGLDSVIPKAEMKPTVTEVSGPLERWHFDVVGPLPVSSKGNSYVLVAQDAFSKWPEAKAVASCPTTQVIIDWLQEAIICRFGTPKEIMTDRGSQLESRECIDWMKSAGINHLLSTPYHHQTNGVVERFNGTLEGRLRTAGESASQSDTGLEKSLHAYRTTAHSVTKRSPFEILHGIKPRLDIDAKLSLLAPQSSKNHTETRQAVKDAIHTEAAKSKERYDRSKRTKWRNLDGLKVYWKDLTPKKDGKLTPRYKGPFLAERTDTMWNYRIKDRDGNTKLVHLDQLKQCYNDEQPLAIGLRGRGRPRRIQTIEFYNSNRKN